MKQVRKLGTLVALVAALAGPAMAQGSRKDGIVFGARGVPVAGATVAVCTQPANTTATPCSPLATLYTDATETATAANPFQADGLGNYHFYAAPGRYTVEFYGSGIVTYTIPDVILPNDPSSPSFSGNISAFTLSLGGNLSVAGNASVTGSFSAGTLNATSVGGVSFTGTPTSGQVPVASSSTTASWGLPSSLAVKPVAADAVEWVSLSGSDSNDGLSRGSAKKTIYNALCSLPGGTCTGTTPTAGKGTVYISDGVSANPTATAGIWIMSNLDPNHAAPPAGWLIASGAIKIICAGSETSPGNSHAPACSVLPPSINTDSNHPVIWLSGTSQSVFMEGLYSQYPGTFAKIGICSTGDRSGTCGVQNVTWRGMANSLNQVQGAGPGVDFGSNTFWVYIYDSALGGNSAEVYSITASTGLSRSSNVVTVTTTATNDMTVGELITIVNTTDASFSGSFSVASVTNSTTFTYNQNGPTATSGSGTIFTEKAFSVNVDPGTGTSAGSIWIWNTLVGLSSGGVRFQTGSNGGGLYVQNIFGEGSGTATSPDVVVASANSATTVSVDGCEVADNTGTTPCVEVDQSGGAVYVNHAYGANLNVKGPAIVNEQTLSVLNTVAKNPWREGQVGFFNNHVIGIDDTARRLFAPAAVRFANLAPQTNAGWSNSCSPAPTFTTGITAPDGTTGATQLNESSGTCGVNFYSTSHSIAVGDYWIAGVWIRSSNANGYPGSANCDLNFWPSFGTGNIATGTTYCGVSEGDGEWQWQALIEKVTAEGTTPSTVSIYTSTNSVNVVQVYAPVVIYIPAGTISDNEAYELARTLASYPTAGVAGEIAQLSGQNFAFGAHANQLASNGDLAGTISISASTSASHTFSAAFTSAPVCALTPTSNPGSLTWWVTTSTTAVTANLSASGTVTFEYNCVGNPN